MSPSPVPSGISPELVTLITGAVTAIAGYAMARVGVRSKSVEKAPEVQEQINKAVAGLLAHYTQALDNEKARHADHVQEMEDRMDRYEARIDQLVAVMKRAGMSIPAEE